MRPFCVATIGVILGIIIGAILKKYSFFHMYNDNNY